MKNILFLLLLNCSPSKTSFKTNIYKDSTMTEDIFSDSFITPDNYPENDASSLPNQVSGMTPDIVAITSATTTMTPDPVVIIPDPVVPVPPVVIIPDHDLCNSPLRGGIFLKELPHQPPTPFQFTKYVMYFFSEVLNDTYTYTWTKNGDVEHAIDLNYQGIFPNSVMNNLGDGNIVNIITLQQLMVQGSSPSERKNSSWSVRISSNKCPDNSLFFSNNSIGSNFQNQGLFEFDLIEYVKTPTEKSLKVCLSGGICNLENDVQFTSTALTITETRSKDTSLWNKCFPGSVSYTVPVNPESAGVWYSLEASCGNREFERAKMNFWVPEEKKGR